MKTCIYCGDIVSFKGHGEITCIDCIEKLKKEEPEPKTPIVTVIGRGYTTRHLINELNKIKVKVEKL